MKQSRLVLLATLFAASSALSGFAQEEKVDRKKYPDYSSVIKADPTLVAKAVTKGTRPDHVNNAETDYFPPVVSQVGGSCGSASRIYYMFTYEINCLRGVKGSLTQNQYPTHFTWLLTNSGSGKDGMAIANGIPNASVYGGNTYSKTFGIQDCSDNDFGWMQGYDKWYSAMFNRLERTANFPKSVESEEGREAVKQWIWNHSGNPDYPGGGICGIGVASACTQGDIPSTTANKAAGVVGKKYVVKWGESVDHALTIVGYDDRIEFDLDGNGVAGETDKDEVGAWIIVNSWGNWANSGFIYCPYKCAMTTATSYSYYCPEIYYIRRNYRPLRTFKINMEYSKRSELKLSAGISADVNATEPEQTTEFEHFKYAGDGDSDGEDAETPMLGRWADGMHYEAMEFGYDLTDLSAGFNTRQPLKYFFIIESKSSASGTGKINSCSLIDYEFDKEGIETPFPIDADGVEIQTKGKKTIISVVVNGEPINAPRNVRYQNEYLVWDAPETSTYTLSGYNVYRNDTLVAQPTIDQRAHLVGDKASYQVAATYNVNDSTFVSPRVDAPSNDYYGTTPAKNYSRTFTNSGFVIKDIYKENRPQTTLEFWLRPASLTSWNQQIGPGWGSNFLVHTSSAGELMAGWNTGSRIVAPSGTLTAGKWQHIAVVFNGSTVTAYVNGEKVGETSSGNNGIGGFGDLSFGRAGSDGINGRVDEVRVWSTARSQREIKSMMYTEVADPTNTPGLLAEVKMTEIGNPTDATGHYTIERLSGTQSRFSDQKLLVDPRETKADFALPEGTIYTNTVVEPTNKASDNVISLRWTLDGDEANELTIENPSYIFTTAGEHTLRQIATDANGTSDTLSTTFTVAALVPPVASFTAERETAVGTRNSFINTTTPASGCTYEWLMPGGTTTRATTTNAATSYTEAGTYTVTLKATNAAGTSTCTKNVVIAKQIPTPDFNIPTSTVLKGATITAEDASTNGPTAWHWEVEDVAHHYDYTDENPTMTLADPGVYSVKLTVSNALGSKSTSKSRAIIVCNADAESGLNFRGGESETVTFDNPLTLATSKAFTFDWWMYPQTTTSEGQHIGGSKSDFMMTTTSDGALNLYIKGTTYSTGTGFITQSEWHHYGVVFDNGTFRVYKDGKLTNTILTPYEDAMPTMPSQLSLGGSDGPMNAIIDEFRIWNTALSTDDLRQYANSPITDVKAAESKGLALYYDFNQTSGNVNDATSNHRTGTRNGFGPEGDAWTTSLGVFCLSNAQREDLTATYLTNYQAPFLHTSERLSNETGMEHLVGLLTGTASSAWVLENPTVKDTITTGISVDLDNGDQMALYTKIGNFYARTTNHKLYQTVTLPAGYYVFGFENNGDVDEESHIVVNLGEGLPNKTDLRKSAYAYTFMTDGEVAFSLDEPTEVSLGLLLNSRGEMKQFYKRFYLERKTQNESFNPVGISATTTDASDLLGVAPRKGGIAISTAAPTAVRVYTVTGALVHQAEIDGTQFVALPTGLYIVNDKKVLVP